MAGGRVAGGRVIVEGFAGMVTMVTQWQSEFELHARAILGLPVDTSMKTPGASAVVYGGVDSQGIVFDGIDDAL